MGLRLSPEEALLVRAAGDGRCALPVADARGPLHWERVVGMARWQRLVPLVWELLRQPGVVDDVPEVVLDELREGTRDATARSLSLQFELDRILGVLEREDIPVILLKGAALVECVYPHPGLRPMSDLDLLVRRSDVERAHEIVQPLGYDVGGVRLHRDDQERLATKYDHFPLVRHGGAIVLELHHGLVADRPEYDVQGMWERAVPGHRAPAHLLQSPEDLALHVAMHFATDRMSRRESALGQLADVVRIADRLPVDWEVVVERARAGRVADRLFLALESVELLFGEVAPSALVRELEPPGYSPAVGERLLRQRVLTEGPQLPLEALSKGPRRVFAGVPALERYVLLGEETPSVARLRARRWTALARRLVTELPNPVALARDARLSRWMLSLRR